MEVEALARFGWAHCDGHYHTGSSKVPSCEEVDETKPKCFYRHKIINAIVHHFFLTFLILLFCEA